jgi:pyruvate,water dikinase
MTLILHGRLAPLDAPLGGKARALAALQRAGFPVPPWLVVLPGDGELSAAEREELLRAVSELAPGREPVAVRSSASDEDGEQQSFAGQLDSFLFVPHDRVPQRVADVRRSGDSERVRAYRREQGLPEAPRPPAVLVQRMIDADASGVAFSADPVTGQRGVAVVSAVLGLGTALVGGEADADTWRVGREGKVLEARLATKRTRHAASPGEGVREEPVPEGHALPPALTDAQVAEVAELARRAAAYFGRPQDIEWALAGGKLYLLQSRPVTALEGRADPDGTLNIWDNSNIAESYNGVTTPLTFSFARRAYEEVYRQFCRLLGVPAQAIEASAGVFRRMLGLIHGTVYYNLLNWYRLIALLPGFKANRGFMEQMMGVKEPLPDDIASGVAATTWGQRLRDGLRLAGSMLAMAWRHLTLPWTVKRFHRRLNQALGTRRPDLSRQRPDEIAAYYRSLERQMLPAWDAPLLNDFFAMIFFGLLGKLCERWCGDGALRNALLGGEGGMISAEPARRVEAMAALARGNPGVIGALCSGSLAEAEAAAGPELRRQIAEYLDRFGDRCLEELKLESATLLDDPSLLLRSVGELARRPAPAVSASTAPGPREQAEARVAEALRWQPVRRMIFWWVLRNARARVQGRENLRFERTRLFGRVRLIFAELGRQLHALGVLDSPRDVFYLEAEEVLGYVEGTASTIDLRGLAGVRRAEFDAYRRMPRLPGRFETRGIAYVGHAYETRGAVSAAAEGEERSGLGCCPGVVRGRARVITDPRGAEIHHGEVLVAERTDPGWVMLFPAASGLLVERGSLLSHSAIVAREMGLPAIVSIPGVTEWLRTGDEVEMDGAAGTVRRLSRGGGP